MGKDTPQNLVEIKMHVRDKHLSQNKMKNWLKHCFGTVNMSSTSQPTLSSNKVNITGSSCTPSSLHITSNLIDFPNAITKPATKDTPAATGHSTQFLSTIIYNFIQQGEFDSCNHNAPIPTDFVSQYSPIQLEELLDFSCDHWITHHQRTGHCSLIEELEIYHLLDTDLPGNGGSEVTIDDTAREILTLSV